MADGKEKLDLLQAKRSGRLYRTDGGLQRRASTSGPPGVPTASSSAQPKTKGMASDDALAQALAKINESLDRISKQVAEASDKIDQNTTSINQNTASINNLGQKVNTNTETIQKLLQESASTREIAEEAKEIATATVAEVQEKIPPLHKQLEDHKSILSMIELKEKQVNLRVRAVPEVEKDNLVEFLTQEFLDFWNPDLGKDSFKIVNAFRLGKGGGKKVRDCLITLRTKEERDKILSLHFQKTLEIQQSKVEIFKDIRNTFWISGLTTKTWLLC
ncbi:Hypothetical predicted protein [Podarcis lilfordi]|uniref:Uncharacterized protein n=1 Tax=Podarcis lilfordi TaxID=74358 RepID=A0AA35QQD1_9SAUR|nr:Hypothetical predicted protein [Podarcis lilfordi]